MFNYPQPFPTIGAAQAAFAGREAVSQIVDSRWSESEKIKWLAEEKAKQKRAAALAGLLGSSILGATAGALALPSFAKVSWSTSALLVGGASGLVYFLINLANFQ